MLKANYRITYDAYGKYGQLLSYGYVLPTGERCKFAPGYNPAKDGFFRLTEDTIKLAKELKIESNYEGKCYRFFSNQCAKTNSPLERIEFRLYLNCGTLDSFAEAYYWVNEKLK